MINQFRSLVLCLIIFTSRTDNRQAAIPLYVTLGPEAPAILRMLVSDKQLRPVAAARLEETLQAGSVTAVIAPGEWLDDSQLAMVRASGVQIVLIKRHTSVANILDNIHTLATFTGSQVAGARWIASIKHGIDAIQGTVAGKRSTRVLVLTPEGYTEGQGALITELIGIAGGINVAAEAGIPEARQIDDQQIRDFAPDVALLINWSAEDVARLTDNALLAAVPAFRQHRLYRVASPGKDPARLLEDLLWLTDLLHPPLL